MSDETFDPEMEALLAGEEHLIPPMAGRKVPISSSTGESAIPCPACGGHGTVNERDLRWIAPPPPAPDLGDRILSAASIVVRYGDILRKRKAKDPEYVGISTGIREIDAYSTYRAGDFWLVAAPTGVGKTAFLQTLRGHLDRDAVPSLFISVEQPWVQLLDRSMAARTGIASWKLLRGILTAEEQDAVEVALQEYFFFPSLLVDDPSLTTKGVEDVIRAVKAKGVQVVFLDFVQRLTDRVGGDSEYVRVTRISNELARIARETQVCIVAASQVSRKGARADGVPAQLSEIRESGHLEQDASVVLVIGRQEGRSESKIAVRKNRHGAVGMLSFYFDQEKTRFVVMSQAVQEVTAPWVQD